MACSSKMSAMGGDFGNGAVLGGLPLFIDLEPGRKMTTVETGSSPRLARFVTAAGALWVLSLLPGLGGCSVLVDANRTQCSQDSDCTKRGAAFATTVCSVGTCQEAPVPAEWSCRGIPAAQTPAYKLTLHLRDVASQRLLSGVTAQLCRKLDINCDNPSSPLLSDDKGTVVISVDAAFDGYVLLTQDKALVPELFALNAPASGDLDLSVSLLSPQTAAGLTGAAGGAWMSERGLVLLNARDCTGATVANVSFSVTGGAKDNSTYVFYTVQDFPSKAATATEATGYGGVVNVPAGVTTVSATLAANTAGARQVGTVTLNVRAGFITYSNVTPSSL